MTSTSPAPKRNAILEFISCTLYCLWLFLPGVLTIVLSFFLFISLSMGQDIVVQVSEYNGPRWWSLVAIFFWAYAIWYSSRIISYRKGRDGSGNIRDRFLMHFPRLMCFNAFLSIQAAILCLPWVQRIAFGVVMDLGQDAGRMRAILWTFVIVNNVLYFFIYDLICGSRRKGLYRLLSLVVILANLGLWVYIFFRSRHDHAHAYVHFLAIYATLLFIIQIVLMRLLMKRENWVGRTAVRAAQQADNKLLLFSRVVVNTGSVDEQNSFYVFNFIFLIGLSMYFSSIGSRSVADVSGTLATAMTAFGFLVGVANLMTFFSTHLRINLFFIWLIVLLISGSFYDPYKVRVKSETRDSVYAQRPDVCAYFKSWVNNPVRRSLIAGGDSTGKFDVYIILSDGGASRSGYWVASVLAALEDATKGREAGRFSNHLLCLSSASGGSVGNAGFYSLLCHRRADSNYLRRAQKFLSSDFLAYLMSHYLGPDIWGHYGVFHDRASALEEVMDAAADSLYPGGFSQTFDRYLDPSARLPILFINTTEVQHGMPGVVSSVKLEGFSQRYDVLHIMDTSALCKGQNIRLSTAAVLSSRFPYISPAGKLGPYYYVDGGYFDNSGAGIVNEMMIKLDSFMKADSDSALYQKLRFRLVHITNGMDTTTPKGQLNALANNLAAPLITVLSTYGSQTDVNNDRLNLYFHSRDSTRYIVEPEINLYRHHETEEYPMNWVISDYNLNRMNMRVKEVIDTFRRQQKYGLTTRHAVADTVKEFRIEEKQ